MGQFVINKFVIAKNQYGEERKSKYKTFIEYNNYAYKAKTQQAKIVCN